MINFPKISIITPSYNQGQYLERTIKSVVEQNYPNVEYIIIDGASKDNSIDIIKKYESYLSYWVSEPDKGQSDALNKGFRIATGEIIVWLNSDDWLDNNALHTIGDFFCKHPNVHVMYGMCTMVYSDNSQPNFLDPVGKVTFRRMLSPRRYGFCPPQPSIFFRRAALIDVGFLDEKLKFAMDLDLWLRLAYKYDFFFVNQNFSFYYFHNDSKSASLNGFHKFRAEWRSVRLYYLRKASLNDKINVFTDLAKSSFNYVFNKRY